VSDIFTSIGLMSSMTSVCHYCN